MSARCGRDRAPPRWRCNRPQSSPHRLRVTGNPPPRFEERSRARPLLCLREYLPARPRLITQSLADTASVSAPLRYGSGDGFPSLTSWKDVNTLGSGRPAAWMRTRANARVQEVTIVHLSCAAMRLEGPNHAGQGNYAVHIRDFSPFKFDIFFLGIGVWQEFAQG